MIRRKGKRTGTGLRRFAARLLLVPMLLAAAPQFLAAQTELGAEDDLIVLGTNGTALDPDAEIKGFTVFGSTQAAYTGAVTGPGNVVVNGVLAVSTGAYFVGNATFTAAGKIFVNDGAAGQLLRKNAAGYLDWANGSALGDDLGTHVATKTLDMASFNIIGVSSVNFRSNVFLTSGTAAQHGGVYTSTNIYTPANLYANNITASKFYGDGSSLSGVSARNYLTVSLPTTVNNYMEIGNFDLTNGAHNLYISVTVSDGGFSVSKQYLLPLNFDFTSGLWRDALPLANTGPYSGNDFTLEVRVSNTIAYLRLRRTSGATAGTALVSIEQIGSMSDSFTPTGGSGTSAVNTLLTATPLTQTVGNVGVGTLTPGAKLDVAGDMLLSGSMRSLTFGSGQGLRDGGTQDLTIFTSAGAPGPVIVQNAGVETARFTVDRKLGIGTNAPSYRLQVSSAAGFAGTMVAVSTGTADVIRLTGDGSVYANRFYGDASGLSNLPSGDSLGTHIATKTVDMASFNLVNVSSVNFKGNVFLASATAANYGGVYVSSNLFVNGKLYGDGSALTGMAGGDSLGTHVATQAVDMASFPIVRLSSVAMFGDGLRISTGVGPTASGIFVSTSGQLLTQGFGNGTSLPAARGLGAVDLQTARTNASRVASGLYSAVSGGRDNTAGGNYSSVSGGNDNIAAGLYSHVAGGISNIAINTGAAILGGSTNNAGGQYATVAGGMMNSASGDYSFAAGRGSSAAAAGAFTWSDSDPMLLVNNVADRAVFKTGGGFLVTGSTSAYMTGAKDRGLLVTGNGLVGISTGTPFAALDVVSSATASNVYAQIWRNSSGVEVASMTSEGKLYADITAIVGGGDNLGNHTATQNLAMASKDINAVAHMSASSATFTQSITASSITASGIGLQGAQLRLASANNLVISSETSAALGAGVRVSTNVYIVGFASATNVHANYFYGNGSNLTGLGGTLSGGQTPKLAYWTAANALGNSSLSYDSANSMTLMGSSFTVQGALGIGAPQLRLDAAPGVTISSESASALGAGVRVSTNVYIVGVASATKYFGDGSSLTGIAGDNLGNHTATQNLAMTSKDINAVAHLSASSATFTQSVTASSITASGIGLQGAQLRLASANNLVISSETSAAFGAGVRVSTNVYIVGFASATNVHANYFYGNGSNLTGLSGTLSGGQTPKIAYWTAPNALGNSSLSYDSANSMTVMASSFTVQGVLGIGAPQLRLDAAPGVTISSETSAALGAGVRVSTNVYIVGFASATNVHANYFYGNGSALTGIAGDGAGDSLGMHVATKTLDMGVFGIVRVASITASGYITTYSSMTVGGILNAGSIYTAGISSFSGNAFFTAVSSFGNVANVHYAGGNAGQVLSKVAGGAMQWSDVSAMVSGDNMGTHVATKTLDIASFNLINVSSVNFRGNVFLTSAPAVNYGGVYASTHVYTPANVYALNYYGNASGMTGLPPGGDSLGTHVATKTVDMASFNLVNVSSVNFKANVFLTSATAPNYGGVYVSSHLYVNGKLYGDGSSLTGLAGGDSLGTHVATQTLNMAKFAIINVSTISATGIYISSYGVIQSTGVGTGTVAGNSRGVGAVDLQVNRGAATQVASGAYAVVSGGQNNTALGQNSTVAGGSQNTAGNQYATVAGGVSNNAGGDSATVPGGASNVASGNYSFAAGRAATASGVGAFLWADSQNIGVTNNVLDMVRFKASGGFMVSGSTNSDMAGGVNRGVIITRDGLLGVSTGVPYAALDVVSTATASNVYAQIWRNGAGVVVASMTSTGTFYTITPTYDNLGNHAASQNLNMSGFSINNADGLTATLATLTSSVTIVNAVPTLKLYETDVAADEHTWHMRMEAGVLRFQAIADAGGGGGQVLDITRAGNQASAFKFGVPATPTLYAAGAAGGSVGIGTGAPQALLEVFKNQAAESAIFVNNPNAGGYPALRLGPSDRATNGDFMLFAQAGTAGIRGGNRPIVFQTGPANADAMSISADGKVGIGVTPFFSTFTVYGVLGAVTGSSVTFMDLYSNTGNADRLVFLSSRATAGADWTTANHTIKRRVDVTDMGYIRFGHQSSDPLTFGLNQTEYMRLDNTGSLAIGSTAPGARLDVKAATATNQIWRNSAGTIMSSMSATGILTTAGLQVSKAGATQGDILFMVSSGPAAGQEVFYVRGNGFVYARGGVTYAGDLAELYTIDGEGGAGDVVMLGAAGSDGPSVTRASQAGAVLGIVATEPGITIGHGDLGEKGRRVPVALSGRVPVKISLENGPVKAGTMLAASATPGKAAAALRTGIVLGMALEDFDPAKGDTVLCFVNRQYWVAPGEFESLRSEIETLRNELRRGR